MCKIKSDKDCVQQQYIFQGKPISLQVRWFGCMRSLTSCLMGVNHMSDMPIFMFHCISRHLSGSNDCFWFDSSGRVAKEVIEASSKIQREPPVVHRWAFILNISFLTVSRWNCTLPVGLWVRSVGCPCGFIHLGFFYKSYCRI